MRNRTLRGILALILTVSLCGCNSILTKKSSKQTSASNKTGIVYDAEKGELVEETTAGDGTEPTRTIDEEYAKDLPDDISGTLSAKLVEDHAELWNIEGTEAFYIPDYHSTKAEDLKDFIILGTADNGNSLIYSYETSFYGDTTSLLNGAGWIGTVEENHVHKNWDIPAGKEDDSSYKPNTSWEVYCLMKYNTVTRFYQVLDVRAGVIETVSSDESEDSVRSTYASYKPGQKRLFCGKVRDKRRRFATDTLYYSVYDMKYTLLNENGKAVKQLDISSMVYTGIADYFGKKFNWNSDSDRWKKLENGGMTYSIANIAMSGNADLLIELNVTLGEDFPQKENSEPYSLLCSFHMYAADSSSEGIKFVASNKAFANQIVAWTDTTQPENVKTYEEVMQKYPDELGWFNLDGTKNYMLCAVKVLKDDLLENDINMGYFSRLFQRYFQSCDDSATEEEKDESWRQTFKELSGVEWTGEIIRTVPEGAESTGEEDSENTGEEDGGTSQDGENSSQDVAPTESAAKAGVNIPTENLSQLQKNYIRVMENICRPTAVNGENVNYLVDQSNKNDNIRFGIYDKTETLDETNTGMGSSIYRTKAAKLQDCNRFTQTVPRYYQGADNEIVEEKKDFLNYVTVQLMDNGTNPERFDTMELSEDKVLLQTPEGDTMYYLTESSEDNDGSSTVYLPNATANNNGIIKISDISNGAKVLYEQTGTTSSWVIAVTGDEAVRIYKCSQSGTNANYKIEEAIEIPYTSTVTPNTEIGESTTVEYEDENGNSIKADVAQKATLTGRNAIEYEEDDDVYRFTTLQSGILTYDAKTATTSVIDAGQYYASWKMADGSYTAVGFKTDKKQDAGFEDIMKAKIYHGLEVSREDKLLLTLKQRLKVDTEMQARFLVQPDGWETICREYDFDPDTNSVTKIKTYAEKVYRIYNDYDAALKKFWETVGFLPTEEKKQKMETQFAHCESVTAMDRIIKDAIEEHLKEQETSAAAETTEASLAVNEVNDGWLKKVQDSQEAARRKQEREKYIIEKVSENGQEEWNRMLEQFVQAAKDKRNIWD